MDPAAMTTKATVEVIAALTDPEAALVLLSLTSVGPLVVAVGASVVVVAVAGSTTEVVATGSTTTGS